MNRKTKGRKTTRREFLKLSAGTAGAAGAAGAALFLGGGCSEDGDSAGRGGAGGGEAGAGAAGSAGGAAAGGTGGAGDYPGSGYAIFSEGSIGKLALKNRLVRSATYESYAVNGEITAEYETLYRALAAGGVGMIISGMMAMQQTDAALRQVGAYDDRFEAGLTRLAGAVRGADGQCKIVAQICHSGNDSSRGTRVGPSANGFPWDSTALTALSTEEVRALVGDFAQAMRRVRDAGWDGAEIHAAHGYLLSLFLSPHTNVRTDAYGGSWENRVRVVREIVEQARGLVGADFPVLVKVNSDDSLALDGSLTTGITPQNFPELAAALENTGVDAIDVSGNNPLPMDINEPARESYFREEAESLGTGLPIVLTGGNRSVDNAEGILGNGKVDFLGLARPLVREPELPNRWLKGESDKATCISCNLCFNNLDSGLRCHQPG